MSVWRPLGRKCEADPDCKERAVQRHHVVLAQHVKRMGGDIKDQRNGIDVCLKCHASHHNRKRPILLTRLTPENLAFADELLGAEYAKDYLARYYRTEPS